MASLLNQTQKNAAAALMDRIHDTFQRNITIIQEVANTSITDDGSFNIFSDRHDPNITYSAIETVITARIRYIDKADAESELIFAGGGGGKVGGTAVPLNTSFGLIRLKFDKQYNDLVAGASKIIVDGLDCQLFYTYSPQSLIDLNYSTAYVIRQK